MCRKVSENYMLRFFLLLLFVAIGCVFMFFLPDRTPAIEIGKYKLGPYLLNKLDILSDLREDYTEEVVSDSIILVGNHSEKSVVGIDSYRNSDKCKYNDVISDSSTHRIISFNDFSASESPFIRIANKINVLKISKEIFRIAFLGDSFIEGDIFTEGIRSSLQSMYSGHGVGLLPMAYPISGFRNSVRIQSSGWNIKSIINDTKNPRFTISGEYYVPSSTNVTTTYTLPPENISSVATLYYTSRGNVSVKVLLDDVDVNVININPSEELKSIDLTNKQFSKIKLSFSGDLDEFISYGVGLDSEFGVSVDCFSIRGHSGLMLSDLNNRYNRVFMKIRNYDIIVFEYGLNVVNNNQQNYSSYIKKMEDIINQVRTDSPNSAIMIMGLSDRCQRYNGDIKTMPAVIVLEKEQVSLAKKTSSIFWSTRLAIKNIGGMPYLASKGLADKDYIHLSHKGGFLLSEEWVRAFVEQICRYK